MAAQSSFGERQFQLLRHKTGVRTEIVAGLTTFMTMSYILFVNPVILSGPDSAGHSLPKEAVMTATCLTAAVMTMLMGLLTNYPLGLAAGMGVNVIVAHDLVGLRHLTWPGAMGVIVSEGLLIVLLVLSGFREAVLSSIPLNLKRAIGAGIGLFIAFLGFQQAGWVQSTPDGLTLGPITSLSSVTAILGFLLMVGLMARGIPGGLLIGILVATGISLVLKTGGPGAGWPAHLLALPRFDTIGRFDFSFFSALGTLEACLVVFSIMLSDFFDALGTVVAVGEQAGLVGKDGVLPKAKRVLLVDAMAAVLGGVTSSSSGTAYIESASGVASGGRTGLTAVVTALCFLAALFFNPLAAIIPAQAVAPALILVGFLMMSVVREIPFQKIEEGLPAFVTMLLIPFTASITNGIAAGFLLYTVLQFLLGKGRAIRLPLLIVDLGFLVYFLKPLIETRLK